MTPKWNSNNGEAFVISKAVGKKYIITETLNKIIIEIKEKGDK